MRAACLLLALFLGISALDCPPAYSDGGDGSCYSCCNSADQRNYQYETCSRDGAYLPDVTNAFQNTKLQQQVGSYSNVWIGLTCTSNDKTSCVWDGTEKPITSSSYSNFYGGAPNVSIGPCVYLNGSNGMWYSADCNYWYNYIYGSCKYTPGVTVPYCSKSYYTRNSYTSYAFRRKCYWTTYTAYGYSDAARQCAYSCGTLASIHSLGENSFAQSLVSSGSYLYTGLTYNYTMNYTWNDNSIYDYSNFGYENPQMGNCVLMSLSPDLIPPGKWINSNCDQTLSMVCEKDWQNRCDTTTTPIPTTTKAPVYCPTPQFFSQNGTIYSPGYPNGMDSTTCEYLFTVDQGQLAQIVFTELSMNYASSLTFFSDLSSQTPFKRLSYVANKTTILSPTNIIRMYFNSSFNDGSYWAANYGPAPNYLKCSSTYFYSSSGSISSPNYPIGSVIPNNCEYVITVDQGQYAAIQFNDLTINYGSQLSFYKDIFTSIPFKTISFDSGPKTVYSPTNIIRMIYNTTGDGSYWNGHYDAADRFTSTQSITTTTYPWWLRTTVEPINPSICGTTYYNSGYITSTDYPNDYPNVNANCSNTLISNYRFTCIVFDVFDIRQGDSVTIYDGATSIIKRFTSANPPSLGQLYYSYQYTYITIVFTTQMYNYQYVKGFTSRFGDGLDSLPTPFPPKFN